MKSRSVVMLLGGLAAWLWLAPLASAGIISPTPRGDGMVGRDWYSNPNFYWVDNSSATIDITHDGGNRWWYRGMVFFDINSLAGKTLSPSSVSYNFYGFGFSGVSLQYANVSGPELTTAYGQLSGSPVAALSGGEGWQSYDITSLVQSSINGSNRYVALVFNATVNYGGGSLAAVEDASNRGSYLSVSGATPEPASVALGALGLLGIWAARHRRA